MMAPIQRLRLAERHPKLIKVYSRIAEPRQENIFQAGIYVVTTVAGLVAFFQLPTMLIQTIGVPLVTIFGVFGAVGSIFSLIAIFPGVHWLERTGVLLLLTAVVMYGVFLVIPRNGVPVGLFIASALAISFIQRLVYIRH